MKPNLMPRKKIWDPNIPIDFPKTKNITTDPKTCLANEIIVWNGNDLNWRYLKSINEDQRDEISMDLLNFFLEYDWSRFEFSKKDTDRDWELLKKYQGKLDKSGSEVFLNNNGTSGSKLYRHFFPNIIKISNGGQASIYDVLTTKEKLFHTIRNRMGNTLLYHEPKKGEKRDKSKYRQWPMNQSISQIIIGAKNSGLGSMASAFKPSVAKTIYEHWVKDGDKILDFSAGFGARLLGLMACGKKDVVYKAYEPNTETYENLKNIIKHFNFKAAIKKCGSEEELFKDKFNFIFSSPPYFNKEKYCDEKTQCYIKYPEYDEWLEKYWRQTVKNIKEMMADDAVFSVNIGGQSNPKMIKIAEDFKKVISEEGFELIDTWWLKTSRSHLSGKINKTQNHKLEGIYFYKVK